MPKTIQEVMTENPLTLDADAKVIEAARVMRDEDIGDVFVARKGRLCGILTDRDIVVRVVAESRDVQETTVGDVCSQDLATVSPTDRISTAEQRMRELSVRRLPVVSNGEAVGALSLGDLAVAQEQDSALAEISVAPAS